MADAKAQADKQLANIVASSGVTLVQFTSAIQRAGVDKHGQIVAFLKKQYGLGHGNANLIAHRVREAKAGGPSSDAELLDAQYAGAKAALRPIYEEVAAIAQSLGDDVQMVVQKTGVSFRRAKQFALVQAPSAKRIQLGLNLDATPRSKRVVACKGMCNHKVNIHDTGEVDDDLAKWLRDAYARSGG